MPRLAARVLPGRRSTQAVAPALLLLLVLVATTASAAGDAEPERLPEAVRLQRFADEFRRRLDIPESVTVTVVPENALLVSVRWKPDHRAGFELSAERQMVEGLDDEALRAIVAHELGHVWVFTHHPYLQTERLANKIALQLVTRESLERVYTRVWERTGTKGDLFPGK